jgi:putative cell wall-binding protein
MKAMFSSTGSRRGAIALVAVVLAVVLAISVGVAWAVLGAGANVTMPNSRVNTLTNWSFGPLTSAAAHDDFDVISSSATATVITFPDNCDLSLVSGASWNKGGVSGLSASLEASGHTVAIKWAGDISLGFGEELVITVNNVRNPSRPGAGSSYGAGVSIDSTTSVGDRDSYVATLTPTAAFTAQGTEVGSRSTTLSDPINGHVATCTVGFTTGTAGRIAGTTGAGPDTISVTLDGGGIPSGLSTVELWDASNATTVSAAASSTDDTVTVTMPSGRTVPNSTAVRVAVAGVTNPAAGAQTGSVHTSAEIGRGSLSYTTIGTYTLSYTHGVGGSIEGSATQVVGWGSSGTTVTAVPDADYHFVNWSDESTADPRIDTSVTRDVDVTAQFGLDPPETTATLAPAGPNGAYGWYYGYYSYSPLVTRPRITIARGGTGTTYWTWDSDPTTGSPNATTGASFTVPSEEGTHTLHFFSVGPTGSTESMRTSAQIKSDSQLPAFTTEGFPHGWQSHDATWTEIVYDRVSGVSAVDMRMSRYGSSVASFTAPAGTGVTTVTLSPTVSAEGTTSVWIDLSDLAGNSGYTTHDVYIDKSAPTVGITGIPSEPTSSSVTFTIEATDTLSGVANRCYQLDSGGQTTYTHSVEVTDSGRHTVVYWATDNAGTASSHDTTTFEILAPPHPETTSTIAPSSWDGFNGWYVTQPVVTLARGSGERTYWNWNGPPAEGESSTATTITVAAPAGDDTLQFQSTSGVVTETVQTRTVRYDATVPTCTVAGIPPTSSAGPVTFSLTATDTQSGVEGVYYGLDGGSRCDYSVPVTVTATGEHTLAYWATDNAGRRETTQTATFTIVAGEQALGGGDRYESAVNASRSEWATGSADTVVIATGQNFPDSLAAAPLAGAYDCPVLVTKGNLLPPSVHDEIIRLGATHALIVGGTGVVTPSVQSQVAALVGGSTHVTRVAGADRYDTSARVAALVKTRLLATSRRLDGTVFIATGTNYPDALSAGPDAFAKVRPLLLVKGALIPKATSDALTALGSSRAVILGGTGVIPQTTANAIRSKLTGARTVQRCGGSDRYATAAGFAAWSAADGGTSFRCLGLATGANYPDGLSGGPVTGKAGGVMLLTKGAALPAQTIASITTNRAAIDCVKFFGGDGIIPPATRARVMRLIQ